MWHMVFIMLNSEYLLLCRPLWEVTSLHSLTVEMTSVPSIPYLVVASEQYIREITLDGRSLRTIVNGQKKARGLSYNYR